MLTSAELRDLILQELPDYPRSENEDVRQLDYASKDLAHFGITRSDQFIQLLREYEPRLREKNLAIFNTANEERIKNQLGEQEYQVAQKTGWYFRYTTVPRFLLQFKFGKAYAEYVFEFFKGDDERY